MKEGNPVKAFEFECDGVVGRFEVEFTGKSRENLVKADQRLEFRVDAKMLGEELRRDFVNLYPPAWGPCQHIIERYEALIAEHFG